MFCLILKFRKKKWTFAKVEKNNVNFFLLLLSRSSNKQAETLNSQCWAARERVVSLHGLGQTRTYRRHVPKHMSECAHDD